MKNKTKRKWNKFYIKWIIHNNIVFYSYLIIGTALVLFLLCSTNIESMKKIPCRFESQTLIIEEQNNLNLKNNQIAYFYVNKNEKVYKVIIKEHKRKDKMIYISISSNDLHKASDGFLEVPVEKDNLLFALLR